MIEFEFVCPECDKLVTVDEIKREHIGVRWVRLPNEDNWRQVTEKFYVRCPICRTVVLIFV